MTHERRRDMRWLVAALLPFSLFQSCSVSIDGLPTRVYIDDLPPVIINVGGDFPHFDGDGEDSLLDRVFGFDDDDD